jgi:phosphoglucosamine mutase
METKKLFGSSGIRDRLTKELLQLAFQVGLNVGNSNSSVIVGGDTRTSTEAMKHVLTSGLLAAGSKAYDAGTIPTPTLAYAARNFDIGVMVTASHNPPEYNGIKLCNPDGSAYDPLQQEQLEEAILNNTVELAPWDRMGRCRTYDGAIEEHMNHILQDFDGGLRLKVAIDCGCGCASLITPYLLERLGCRVIAINCQPSGFFPREIEPTSQSLVDLMDTVKATNADLGIAHDGDGDRMVVVDDKGRFVPGDKLLVILARELKAKKVVTTVESSMMIDEAGFEVVRTKVGDSFVSHELKKGGDFGGEPSGAWIFPRVSLCPDGIRAAIQILQIAGEGRLSDLIDGIPSYPILRGSVPGDKGIMLDLKQRLTAQSQPLQMTTIDGTKLHFPDGWLLVRPSGTEPKIRLACEARSPQRAQELYGMGIHAIEECCRAMAASSQPDKLLRASNPSSRTDLTPKD